MSQTNGIAVAIVIGFALVAGAILLSEGRVSAVAGSTSGTETPIRAGEIRHLYGEESAPTTIVEFSDYECPFCARVHPTLKRIVDESDGAINWEYRHLPLTSHPHAPLAAFISECVAEEVGNDAFWSYTDRVFAGQRQIDPNFLRGIAVDLGVETDALETCIAAEATIEQVEIDTRTAVAFGGNGTPFSVIVYPDGTTKPVSGALPYEQWVSLLTPPQP